MAYNTFLDPDEFPYLIQAMKPGEQGQLPVPIRDVESFRQRDAALRAAALYKANGFMVRFWKIQGYTEENF